MYIKIIFLKKIGHGKDSYFPCCLTQSHVQDNFENSSRTNMFSLLQKGEVSHFWLTLIHIMRAVMQEYYSKLTAFFNKINYICHCFLVLEKESCLLRKFIRTIQLKCDGTRWRKRGKVKGKLANEVGSQYPSHYLGVSSITTADAHTSAASSQMNWRHRQFKLTCPFRRKTKFGFCACAITFQTQSTCYISKEIT
jgi:hypothetical protein